ncbi:collagen-like protein [bacterium]|nr:collagen-like protein [bacterium]
MATFLDLTDSPDDYNGKALKFVRVNAGENALSIAGVELSDLSDVNASGGYAPTDTQILQYSAAAGEWRPLANDPYSSGNGLSKTSATFNVVGGTGIEANASGVHIADVSGLTAGTYGSGSQVPVFAVNQQGQVTSVTATDITIAAATSLTADYVETTVGTAGQITVTGGTGNKSTATVNLVATGVTSGVYGNTTTIPQITVDTYGRIQNVDLIAVSGGGGGSGGNVELAFKNFAVTGQTTIGADGTSDTITFSDGNGIDITTNSGTDTMTISANLSEIGAGLSTSSIGDVSTTSPTNGQVLKYNSSTSKYEPFTLTDATGIALTDLSGSTGITYDAFAGSIKITDTGVTAKTYGNTSVIPQITVNAQGQITNVSNVSLDDASGVTAGTYGTATSLPQFTVNSAGKITNIANVSIAASTQTLTWNAATDEIGISGGSTIDISSIRRNGFGVFAVDGQSNMVADAENDTLNIEAGSGITITTNSATDTLTITNSGSSGTASVVSLTDTTISSPSNGQVLKYNSSTSKWENSAESGGGSSTLLALTDVGSDGTNGQVLTTNGSGAFTFTTPASAYGDSDVGSYLTAQGFANQSTIVAAITDSAPGTLDTLNELAAALGDDANFSTTITNSIATKAATSSLSSVATSGLFNDLTSRPTIALSGSNLTYDGTTVNLSGVGATGPQGPAGSAGATGPAGSTGAAGNGVTNVAITGDELIFTYANSSVQNLGDVKGATGAAGPQGPAGTNGTSISSGAVSAGTLTLTMSDSSTVTVSGSVAGATGSTGATGPAGPTGATGPAGNDGADGGGAALTDFNAVTISASGTGAFAYNSGTGVYTYTPPDLSSFITSETFTSVVQDTTPQLGGNLDINGKDIVTLSNGDIDLDPNGTGVVVFKGNATKGSGQFKLNCENNSHGVTIKGPAHSASANYTLTLPTTDGNADQVLKTDGSGGLAWVDQSAGGGATTLNALTDVSTAGVTTGQVLKYNGASWAPAADNNSGGGGGSGAKVLRFKLNYDSSGNLTSTSNLSTGISSAIIDSASGGDMTITFDSGTYNYPPGSVMAYGYDYTNNVYLLVPMSTTMGLRQIAGGGSSGTPTLFNGSSAVSLKLRLREAETGASRSFGTTTHAWIQFTMYD